VKNEINIFELIGVLTVAFVIVPAVSIIIYDVIAGVWKDKDKFD
jgi:hypothetical protein